MSKSIYKIGDLYEIKIGGTPSRSNLSFWRNGIHSWASIRDLTNNNGGIITETSEKITDSGVKHSNVKLLPKGTILMSFKLSLGKLAIAGKDLYTNEAICGFINKKPEVISDSFFYHLLSNIDFTNFSDVAVKGATLNKEKLEEIEIEIPVDIEEQKRIAGILSNVDSTIKVAEEEYDQLNRLLEGFMNDSFSSLLLNEIDSVKLDGLGEVSRGKSKHRPRNDPSLFGGKYPFIQTGKISNSVLFVEKYENTYNEKGLKQSKLWKKGTLCITIAANIAETAILNFDACFPDSIIGFVPFDSTNIFYVKMHLDYIKTKLLQAAVGGGQMNLNTEKLLSFDFFNPPKEEQDRLGNLYLLFHKLINNKTMEINKLIVLKKGLLQQLIK